MDTRDLRYCFGRFATGVTVVTYNSPEGRRGLTANSFTSVSLDPPLLLISIGKNTKAAELLSENAFAVNILTSDQQVLSDLFAGREVPKIEIPWREGEAAPYLDGSLAVMECMPWQEVDAGDHILFLGEIKRYEYRDGEALGFYKGRYLPVSEPART